MAATTIKELRKRKGFTQQEASAFTGIPLRTYKVYENDAGKVGSIKYAYIVEKLEEAGRVDETHGVLSVSDIVCGCSTVFEKYEVDYCILFGSYARGTATDESDIDLVISSKETGLQFFGIIEELRETLHKKLDLLDLDQLTDNKELIDEVLKYGKKVYEKKQ